MEKVSSSGFPAFTRPNPNSLISLHVGQSEPGGNFPPNVQGAGKWLRKAAVSCMPCRTRGELRTHRAHLKHRIQGQGRVAGEGSLRGIHFHEDLWRQWCCFEILRLTELVLEQQDLKLSCLRSIQSDCLISTVRLYSCVSVVYVVSIPHTDFFSKCSK